MVEQLDLARRYLQLPSLQWGAGNVQLKVNIAENPIAENPIAKNGL